MTASMRTTRNWPVWRCAIAAPGWIAVVSPEAQSRVLSNLECLLAKSVSENNRIEKARQSEQ